ncbi:MAG: hypothetical protein HKO66_00235 [Saprospiraceae bacterium]|nr:hypothetical protein [Saprospiraceae bacterium]
MNLKVSFSKFYSVLLVALFFVSFSSTASAQLTIENASYCNLWVSGAQMNSNTLAPCDECNLVSLRRVPPSQSIVVPYNPSCGVEVWKQVFYSAAPSGAHVASSENPSVSCGGSSGSVDCLGTPIDVTWNSGTSVTLK